MALVNGCTHLGEPLGNRATAKVGAGDAHPQRQQDFGNPAHPDAANSNEVNVLLLNKHA
jgi:hypothetical protein